MQKQNHDSWQQLLTGLSSIRKKYFILMGNEIPERYWNWLRDYSKQSWNNPSIDWQLKTGLLFLTTNGAVKLAM